MRGNIVKVRFTSAIIDATFRLGELFNLIDKSAMSSADQLAILFVGRLQARKRIDSLFRACAEMPGTPRLVIVGDGPERQTLEQVAKQVYPSAEFIGAKHGGELKPYFAEADLFVLPGTGGLTRVVDKRQVRHAG